MTHEQIISVTNHPELKADDSKDDYKDLSIKIKTDLIEPSFYNDVQTNLKRRTTWKNVGTVAEVISKVLAGIAAILAFAAGFFNYQILAFISGSVGTASMVVLHFSTFAKNESNVCTDEINKILTEVGLTDLSDIAVTPVADVATVTPV